MREIGKIGLNVTNRSGFDKSHRNLFTGKTGTLIPILTEEVLPNSTIRLREAIAAKMPPLAADTFMNVQLKTEAFFVPYRLLYAGWENWLMETPLRTSVGVSYKLQCPCLDVNRAETAAGTLADYLGWKSSSAGEGFDSVYINIFPFLAYHRIYDDWYRNSKLQSPLFTPAGTSINYDGQNVFAYAGNMPFISIPEGWTRVVDGTRTVASSAGMNGFFADGSYIMDFHQRNFGLDYFTSAQPSAQRGQARKVTMVVNGTAVDVMNESGDGTQSVIDAESAITTEFTIASLRAQNSLQQFCERNNFSYRASDYYYVNYGSRLRSGLATRPVFLGQHVLDVYSKTVNMTVPYDDNNLPQQENPFNSVGAQYGQASAQGNDTLVDNFTCDEPGILMVLCSLVPRVTYNTGKRRYLNHFTQEGSQVDLANAILQNVGDQPIYGSELSGSPDDDSLVFGYTDRFAEWMDHPDEIHGELKDGKTLQSFALQRAFLPHDLGGIQPINGDFLKIPENYLDQVFATSIALSKLTYWAEAYFDFKVIQPLNEYSIPSLQDPAYEHGHRVVVNKNGGSL